MDPDEFRPTEDGFWFAISMRNQNFSVLDDYTRQHIDVKVYQVSSVASQSILFNHEDSKIQLPLAKRSPELFVKFNLTSNHYNITNYAWVKNNNHSLKGSRFSDENKYIRIEINKCQDTTGFWLGDYDVQEYLRNIAIEVTMPNSYFNVKKFSEPIGSYLTQTYYYVLAWNAGKQSDIFVKENNLKLMDNFFEFGDPDSYTFYSVSD